MAQKWIANDFGGIDVLQEIESPVPAPGVGEVTIDVRAAGMNPADYKMVLHGQDRRSLPLSIGYEVAGVIAAIGPETRIASGGGAIGDEVIAFRISGGYASSVTVSARNVFAKPANLNFAEAANLMLAGTTAADMLNTVGVSGGETILVHGASGAVGVSVLQQARLIGARVFGTASERNFDLVREFGGEPIPYGDGLEDRVRAAVPEGIAAALDTVGTDEAIDVSLALVSDRQRIVSIAAFGRAQKDDYRVVGGSMPGSLVFRDEMRANLIRLVSDGSLVVPVAKTFPLAQAKDALTLLASGHPGGKLALIPEQH
jgi:NADPH:quinone reductase-like Zn-dependent oxidoreductase